MSSILGIGGVTLDRVSTVPRMPAWDEVGYASRLDARQGGMVATAMMAAARLGADAEYVGAIGDDAEGSFLMDAFRIGGVKADRVKKYPGERTPVSFVLVHEKTGERTIIHHRGVQEKSSLGIRDLDLEGVGYLHLDGYWYDTALAVAREGRSGGITICVDPSTSITRDKAEQLFPLADYIIPSRKYAERITGEGDPEKAAGALLQFGARAVIITLGSGGCVVASPGNMEHVPAFGVNVVDTTGAGDSFHGGFVFAISRGMQLHEAAVFSSAVAALKCARPATLPALEDVERFLSLQG